MRMVKWKSHYAHKRNIFGQNWPLTLVYEKIEVFQIFLCYFADREGSKYDSFWIASPNKCSNKLTATNNKIENIENIGVFLVFVLIVTIYLQTLEVCMTQINRCKAFCLIATGSKQLVVADNLSDYYNQQLYPCNNCAPGLICCYTEDTADVLVIKYVMMMIIWWWWCMFAIICDTYYTLLH